MSVIMVYDPPRDWVTYTVAPAFSGILSPYGMAATSTSRLRVLASRIVSSLLRLHRLGLAVHGGLERVPRQARALHPHGELAHARESRELAQLRSGVVVGLVRGRGHELVEALEERLGVRAALALQG